MLDTDITTPTCFVFENTDPFLNIAAEEFLLEQANLTYPLLLLWQNKPCVIIGRFQNPRTECNNELLKKHDIVLVRRMSGGGAVYQDLGNFNFTILTKSEQFDIEKTFAIIVEALNKIGINAVRSGRNDILVHDKKISGSAFKRTNKNSFHHGTILHSVDLDILENVLTPNLKKIVSKGINSVRSRVLNVNDSHEHITKEIITRAIIEQFFSKYNAKEKIITITEKMLTENNTITKKANKLNDPLWIFGETPEFHHTIEERFDWGIISLHFTVEHEQVVNTTIYSDCLYPEIIESIYTVLKKCSYTQEQLIEKLNTIKVHLSQEKIIEDIKELIRKNVT